MTRPVLASAAHSSGHALHLDRAYRDVGDLTWQTPDFLAANLAVSRDLFTPESLLARRPRPKSLEVFALLAGLPFSADLVTAMVGVQKLIAGILGDRLHYWVASGNLGVEFCVFKWPSGPWDEAWLGVIQDELASIGGSSFRFDIGGFQINPDGCVVAKGYDGDAQLFRIRERLKAVIPFLPSKQSSWAHVPLGRILEPLGTDRFARLRDLIGTLSDARVGGTMIGSMKFVHETRWYMEERTVVAEYPLQGR